MHFLSSRSQPNFQLALMACTIFKDVRAPMTDIEPKTNTMYQNRTFGDFKCVMLVLDQACVGFISLRLIPQWHVLRYAGLMWSLSFNHAPKFQWYIVRLVVRVDNPKTRVTMRILDCVLIVQTSFQARPSTQTWGQVAT